MKREKTPEKKGVRTKMVLVPIVLIMAFLQFSVLSLIYYMNMENRRLIRTMQDTAIYIDEATSLLGGSSLLSETSSNFILLPVTDAGEINMNPLAAYSTELGMERRGEDILGRFQSYDVTLETLEYLEEAAACTDFMISSQLHAMALVNEVYPIPDSPAVGNIHLPELTDAEKAMSAEEKLAQSKILILNGEYGLNKQTVSRDVNTCVDLIRQSSGENVDRTERLIRRLRIAVWITVISIILILIVTFAEIYRAVIRPLMINTRFIATDSRLDEENGVREIRLLSEAYNGLLDRRKKLEEVLRSAAETDPLTNLPNRYAFEQHIMDMDTRGRAVAIFQFDVNYLKRVNDTQGHEAGDHLLREASESILTCFGNMKEDNCYRFGGDEFCALVLDATEEMLERMEVHFEEDQKRRNISVSWGAASSSKEDEISIADLMEKADKDMYMRKRKMHAAME